MSLVEGGQFMPRAPGHCHLFVDSPFHVAGIPRVVSIALGIGATLDTVSMTKMTCNIRTLKKSLGAAFGTLPPAKDKKSSLAT